MTAGDGSLFATILPRLADEIWPRLWFIANRLAVYAQTNLLDDPAILAMAFC